MAVVNELELPAELFLSLGLSGRVLVLDSVFSLVLSAARPRLLCLQMHGLFVQ